MRFLPVTFFPPSEERLLVADVELPAGTALGRTSERLRPFEDFLQQDAGIKSYQVSIGGEDTQDPESPVRPGNKAQAFINVRETRTSGGRWIGWIERVTSSTGRTSRSRSRERPATGRARSRHHRRIQRRARKGGETVSDEFRKLEDVNNVESDLSGGNPEVEIKVDPEKAARAGLSPVVVSGSLGLPRRQHRDDARGYAVVGVPEGSVDSLDEVRGCR